MPNGVEPPGSAVGDEGSSERWPPLTAKPLTVLAPVSTTHNVAPSGASRASSGPRPVGSLNTVLPRRVREPFGAIEYTEMLGTAVLTVKRNRPSWVISTQQGAVCRSG